MESILTADAIRQLVLFAPPFILCLSIHEWAHAWAANKLGDPTAKNLGRLTIDPMAHISFFGTIVFPAIGILTGGMLFGWAKPVPVDPRNFKYPRQHMAVVAVAGPISNFIQAFVLTAILSFLLKVDFIPVQYTGIKSAGIEMVVMAIRLNLFLAFFNLIPIPPLDGGRILQGIVPRRYLAPIEKIGEQGQWIILLLLFTGALRYLAIPVYKCFELLLGAFSINY